MADLHTPEPWAYEGSEILAERNGQWVGIGLMSKATVYQQIPERDSNGKRVVACVNACTGIPTAALEAGAVRALVDAAQTALGWIPDARVYAQLRTALEPFTGDADAR